MEIADRIDYLVKELAHDNARLFAKKAGVPESSVSKWRRGEREPKSASMEKILAAYPEVRREWLVHGKGKPILGEKVPEDSRIVARLDALEKKMDAVLALLEKYR